MTFINHFGMFVQGFKDSIDFTWIREILLYTDPQTKKIHPSSKKLLHTIFQSLIQVGIFLIAIPYPLLYFGYNIAYNAVTIFFLILTFG
jgi:hypothetical protein